MAALCSFLCGATERTYQRLIDDVYKSSEFDRKVTNIAIHRGKIEALVGYCVSYPQKLAPIVARLDKILLDSILRSDHGFVVLTIDIFRALLRKYHYAQLAFMLESHLNFVIRSVVQTYDPLYMRSVSKLLKDCIRLDVFSNEIDFIDAIIDLCEDPSFDLSNQPKGDGEEPPGDHVIRFMACTLLTISVRILHTKPTYLDAYLTRIVKIIFLLIRDSTSAHALDASILSNEVDRCQNLLPTLQSFVPHRLSELGWKAWHCLCSHASASSITDILLQMILCFAEADIPFSSRCFFQAMYILASVSKYCDLFTALPSLVLNYLFMRFSGMPLKALTTKPCHQLGIVHDGSESMLRDRSPRILKLDDGLGFVMLWINAISIRTTKTQQPIESFREIPADMLPIAVGNVLAIIAYLVKMVPALIKYDPWSGISLSKQESREQRIVRLLPSVLLNATANSLNDSSPPMDIASCRLLRSLFRLTEQLGKSVMIGSSIQIVVGQIVTMVEQIAQVFTGNISENLLLQHYYQYSFITLQVLFSHVNVDYRAITICQSRIPVIISDQNLQLLLSVCHGTTSFEVLRHTCLAIMSILALSRPLCEYYASTHAVVETMGLHAKDTWSTNWVFYPHSALMMHRLLCFLHDHVCWIAATHATNATELTRSLSVVLQLLVMIFRNHGPPAMLSAIPSLYSLMGKVGVTLVTPASIATVQCYVLVAFMSMGQILASTELVATMDGYWKTAGLDSYFTLNPTDLSLSVATSITNSIESMKIVECDKQSVLRILLSCPGNQSVHPSYIRKVS